MTQSNTETLPSLHFDNRFVAELPGDPDRSNRPRQVYGAAWSEVEPTPVREPRLLAHAREVAELVGLSGEDVHADWFPRVFAGNELLPGMRPYAACYGGHQFGHWAGQLGDGRAITLGEVVNARGERWELQLKGAGPTPYSRRADGRAVLRSSIREFLCSEAMHHLGVPTTRALCVVTTGEPVIRDMFYDGHPAPEPGAVVCRVAPSFIRFGNFEIFTARDDIDNLSRLVDFTIRRDFAHLVSGSSADRPRPSAGSSAAQRGEPRAESQEVRRAWLSEVCERTARMIVHWMRVGFVHGVMNTDNMSVLGLTIDYGPYGWLDDFDPNWTPNTTDRDGRRYRYGWQPRIAQWNLVRLAEAVLPLFDSEKPVRDALDRYGAVFAPEYEAMILAKAGLRGAEGDAELAGDVLKILYEGEMDYTLFFRALGEVRVVPDDDAAAVALLGDVFYDEGKRIAQTPALAAWLRRWHAAASRDGEPFESRRERMHQVNPRYVLRNYLAQEAIDAAEAGDPSVVHTLLEVMRRPYDDQPEHARHAARRPEWARSKAGCSMLSCSS